MSKKLIDFLSKYDFLDKLLLTLTLLAPFALLMSILIADIIASLISLIILYRVIFFCILPLLLNHQLQNLYCKSVHPYQLIGHLKQLNIGF